jgi:retron-type reverse transcriptase
VYIQKEDGRQRPLGVAALEDKIVQYAVATILNQIYKEDFRIPMAFARGAASMTRWMRCRTRF